MRAADFEVKRLIVFIDNYLLFIEPELEFTTNRATVEMTWGETAAKPLTEKLKQGETHQVIDAFGSDAKFLEDALFLINGYHVHSKQWRRKAK